MSQVVKGNKLIITGDNPKDIRIIKQFKKIQKREKLERKLNKQLDLLETKILNLVKIEKESQFIIDLTSYIINKEPSKDYIIDENGIVNYSSEKRNKVYNEMYRSKDND